MLVGGIMQVVGFALLSTVGGVGGVERKQYGFQVLGGFGAGMAVGMVVVSTPWVVGLRDQCAFCVPFPTFSKNQRTARN